jgi:ABC-type nitrate/sulfonate/bicarbonate transport system permease component
MPSASGSPASIRSRIWNSAWTWRAVALLVVAMAWQGYAIVAHNLLIPTFTDTILGVWALLGDPVVLPAFLISNQALAAGFIISVAMGIPLGLVLARFRTFEAYVDPYLAILMVTPMAALIPILMMSLGIGLASRVVLVVTFAVPVVIVNARAGIRQVDPTLIEMATSYGATEREIWREVLLPGALPAVMVGVRLALGRAVTGMVIIELLMVAVGIGGLILEYRGTFASDLLYGLILLVIFEALALVSVIRLIERRAAPWAHQTALNE